MEILLVEIIIVLGIIICIQHNKYQSTMKEIRYINQKLNEIMESNTHEYVKVVTNHNEIKHQLESINLLLDYCHKKEVKYNKARISMKKMLSNVSHDLKTPLTVVLGYLELLDLKHNDDETIHKTYIKVQEVLELINKFFDLAKLDAGDKEVPLEKVDLCEICRMKMLAYYEVLEKQAFKVEINLPEKPIYIRGNEGALNRILNNLISNAIKYGGDGKYLGLTLKEDNEKVTVEVIDKGKGIKEQYKEEVFERLYTLEDSRSKTYQGSGLGLTITKELVETLGGEIHLDSIPYKQTVFYFTFDKLEY